MHAYLPVCVCARILLKWDVTAADSAMLELAWIGFARVDYYICKNFASQLTSHWRPEIKCAGSIYISYISMHYESGFMIFFFF